MRSIYLAMPVMAAACFALTAVAENLPDPSSITSLNLTRDEQVIYETLLQSWLGRKHAPQLVDQRLGPPPSTTDNAECAGALRFPGPIAGTKETKTLDPAALHIPNIKLIDGAKWSAADPETAIRQGKAVDAAVSEGFSHSLIYFSQIRFTQDRKDALVKFGMACGSLCGTGFTLIMHKSNGRWRDVRRCSSYIS